MSEGGGRRKRTVEPGAGDRDRTGDIQLGKVTLPFARRGKIFKNLEYAHKHPTLMEMRGWYKAHISLHLHVLSPISVNYGQYGQ
jgi:hypothetical protein